MPATLDYSVAIAIHTLWLAARAEGIGVGWVSILDPARVAEILGVPQDWTFIGHLCIGYPEEEADLAAPGLGAAPPFGGRRDLSLRLESPPIKLHSVCRCTVRGRGACANH
jgi:hypothetical protein